MSDSYKLPCEYKQVLIDSFQSNDVPVQVFVCATKKSIKEYCKDADMPFKKGMSILYNSFKEPS